MDEPAAERSRPRPLDESSRGWGDRLRRALATVGSVTARWRRRTGETLLGIALSLRRAARYYVRGGGTDRPLLPREDRPSASMRALRSPSGSVERSGQADHDEGRDQTMGSLPRVVTDSRNLPSTDRRLRAECTAGRMTLSDPDREDAYLTSTVWVDVEQ